jgi:hypothetical protein
VGTEEKVSEGKSKKQKAESRNFETMKTMLEGRKRLAVRLMKAIAMRTSEGELGYFCFLLSAFCFSP